MGDQITLQNTTTTGESPRITIHYVESKTTTEIRPLALVDKNREEIGEAYYSELPTQVFETAVLSSSSGVVTPLPPIPCIAQCDGVMLLFVVMAVAAWSFVFGRKTRKNEDRPVPDLQGSVAPTRLEDLPLGSIDVVILSNSGRYRHVHTARSSRTLPATSRSRGLPSLSGCEARAHSSEKRDLAGRSRVAGRNQAGKAGRTVPKVGQTRPSVADYLAQRSGNNCLRI